MAALSNNHIYAYTFSMTSENEISSTVSEELDDLLTYI